MDLSDKEKLRLGLEGIQAFLGQFPTDVYSKVTLEVLLDELLYYSDKNGKKSIPVSSETRQEGGKASS